MSWLQRRLGVKFFEPDGRSIRATEAAFEYAARAREFVDEVHRFELYSSGFGQAFPSRETGRIAQRGHEILAGQNQTVARPQRAPLPLVKDSR